MRTTVPDRFRSRGNARSAGFRRRMQRTQRRRRSPMCPSCGQTRPPFQPHDCPITTE